MADDQAKTAWRNWMEASVRCEMNKGADRSRDHSLTEMRDMVSPAASVPPEPPTLSDKQIARIRRHSSQRIADPRMIGSVTRRDDETILDLCDTVTALRAEVARLRTLADWLRRCPDHADGSPALREYADVVLGRSPHLFWRGADDDAVRAARSASGEDRSNAK